MTLDCFLYPDQGYFGRINWCETTCKKIMKSFDLDHVIGPHAQYLLVTNDKEGTDSVMAISDDELLDLEALIIKWIQREYGESCSLCQPFDSSNKIFGDYYAAIITDWRPKDTVVIWEGAYFFVNYDEK